MLPFLKNQQEASMGESEEPADKYDMLRAVAQDMLEALSKKDEGLLRSALEALVEHIQDKDMEQDESLTNKEE